MANTEAGARFKEVVDVALARSPTVHTMADLIRCTGLHPNTIYDIFNGDLQEGPGPKPVNRIADCLDIPTRVPATRPTGGSPSNRVCLSSWSGSSVRQLLRWLNLSTTQMRRPRRRRGPHDHAPGHQKTESPKSHPLLTRERDDHGLTPPRARLVAVSSGTGTGLGPDADKC